MKQYFKYVISAALLIASVSGCKKEDPNRSPFDNKMYITQANKVDRMYIKGSIKSASRSIAVATAMVVDREMAIRYDADPSRVATYNQAYYDDAVLLPAEYYSFSSKDARIPAKSALSTAISIDFEGINNLDRAVTYVLPVSIVESDMEVLESARTIYYVFKAAALINVVADGEENNFHVQWKDASVCNNLSQLTVEALIRARNYDRLISTVMGIEGKFLIRLGDANFPSNQIQIATNSGNFPSSDAKKGLPTNEWTHIALTYNSTDGAWKIYVNGKVQSEGTKSMGAISLGVGGSDGFYLGRSYADDRFLAGEFSECRIWNVVRTEEEIAGNPYEVAPDATGLVAYWKFDEGSGDVIRDHANGNNAKAKTAVKWTPVELPAPSNY